MKKNDLKKVLRPIVEELVEEVIGEVLLTEGYLESKIKEAIFEGKILKSVVSQVAEGLKETSPAGRSQTISQVRRDYPTPVFNERRNLSLEDNKMVKKLKENKNLSHMFEGTNPLQNSGETAILKNGEPNFQDPLSVAATIPNPELGGEVSPSIINSLLGGRKFKF
jgi:hypothetical protein